MGCRHNGDFLHALPQKGGKTSIRWCSEQKKPRYFGFSCTLPQREYIRQRLLTLRHALHSHRSNDVCTWQRAISICALRSCTECALRSCTNDVCTQNRASKPRLVYKRSAIRPDWATCRGVCTQIMVYRASCLYKPRLYIVCR